MNMSIYEYYGKIVYYKRLERDDSMNAFQISLYCINHVNEAFHFDLKTDLEKHVHILMLLKEAV